VLGALDPDGSLHEPWLGKPPATTTKVLVLP